MDKNPYQVIRASYPSYSKVFRIIADYILRAPEHVLQANIHQLGKELGIAESSIVRFCKLIGYSGFSELKIMLAKYGGQRPSIIFESFEKLENNSPEERSKRVFSLTAETLRIAAEELDYSSITRTAEMINQAERIWVCGVGSSSSVCDSFAVHLMRVGIMAESVTDSELLPVAARLATPKTLLIGISKGGRSTPVVKAFEIAKLRGAMTVCMTGYESTPLEKFCDCSIVHYCPDAALMSSRIVQSTIIDCICINATADRQAEVQKLWNENQKLLEGLRM